MLYTADAPTGALIEKLQRFRSGGDDEAVAILAGIKEDVPDPVRLEFNVVPASVLRNLAVSELQVFDDSARVVDPCDLATIHELYISAPEHGVESFESPRSVRERITDTLVELGRRLFPWLRSLRPSARKPPKPADLIGSHYGLPQRASVIIFESQRDIAGIVSLSSLDNPRERGRRPHLNFNLYRDVPEKGSDLRASILRSGTALAVDRYRGELQEALDYLSARPEKPLDDIAGS